MGPPRFDSEAGSTAGVQPFFTRRTLAIRLIHLNPDRTADRDPTSLATCNSDRFNRLGSFVKLRCQCSTRTDDLSGFWVESTPARRGDHDVHSCGICAYGLATGFI